MPTSGPDNLVPDVFNLGDVNVDTAQIPSSPYLDPTISNTDNSSVHVC